MAHKDELLRSIRKAMQGEMDSVTLYENAANHSGDPEVKQFFASRREEERQHYNYLLQYYQQVSSGLEPCELKLEQAGLHPIVSADFVKRIGEDQYLFSAISTALLLEKDAFEHYRAMTVQTESTTLKSFFSLLEKWELKHYDELLQIQKDAEAWYWEANQFEPF